MNGFSTAVKLQNVLSFNLKQNFYFFPETLKELREKADNFSVLNEIVQKLTDEKLNFVAEKDDLKKKLKLTENEAEKLSDKLRVAEEKVDVFVKDVEQNKEIVKKLRRKIENLETENEGTKR